MVPGSYLVFGFSCSLLPHLGHLLYAVALLRNKELVFWGVFLALTASRYVIRKKNKRRLCLPYPQSNERDNLCAHKCYIFYLLPKAKEYMCSGLPYEYFALSMH